MTFRLVTLGELSLRDADTGRKLAIPRKALALMAVLASAGGEGVPRERIVSLLWPNAEGSGRGALKQTIYELRQILGNHSVIVGTSDLSLDAREITSDLADILALHRAEDWAGIAKIYAGPFLDQFHLKDSAEFEHWVDRARQHYSGLFRKALEKSALTAEAIGDTDAAVQLWRRLSAEDPLDARYALGLLNALDATGDSAAALKHYSIHEQLLREELGTNPEPAVADTAERIRAGRPRIANGVSAQASSESRVDETPLRKESRRVDAPSLSSQVGQSRKRWIVFALALVVLVAAASGLALSGRRHARVVDSIELPHNASMRVTVDVELDKVYTDGGASFDHALAILDGESHRMQSVAHGSGVVADPLTHWYWSGDYGGRFVVIRNGRTNAEIGRVTVPGCPHHLASAGSWILVAEQCDDQISVIDSRTRALVRNIPIATLSRAEVGGAKGMGEIFFNPNTRIAYFWKDMLPHRLDTRTWEIRETPDFGGPVMGVDSANNRLYVKISDGLRVLDGATEQAVASVPLGSPLLGRVAVGFGGNRVYAITSRGLSIIDGRKYRVISTLSFSGGFVADGVASDDSKGRVYVVGTSGDGKRFLKILDVS